MTKADIVDRIQRFAKQDNGMRFLAHVGYICGHEEGDETPVARLRRALELAFFVHIDHADSLADIEEALVAIESRGKFNGDRYFCACERLVKQLMMSQGEDPSPAEVTIETRGMLDSLLSTETLDELFLSDVQSK